MALVKSIQSLWQKAFREPSSGASALAVVNPDGSSIGNYSYSSSTSVVTSVSVTSGGATLKAANSSRKFLLLYNNSATDCYVKLGSAASTTDFSYKLAAGGLWAITPDTLWLEIITGVTASGTATILVTECT